ncbi:hypothetical protein G7085_01725 [Tessaracoccus sp. HDW20]|uniref:hypothetical protein n=1 Tax=Tessaracoccus coleopterorum TaxID=2714950 RepID=UPI0018D44E65|nr:hypothetical protein [Tessaracoccus coleopterorum]NHB83837.1 hypothetical protein [Tessaracoccus coleopterorum]
MGTRGSALALARSEEVAAGLRAAGHEVEVLRVATSVTDSSHLPEGYSVVAFAKELRQALREGTCDLVVHSVKDIPLTDEPDGLTVAAVLKRGDHRDALVSLRGVTLAALPRKSRIGVTSLRRVAQVRALRPDLTFIDLGEPLRRGSVASIRVTSTPWCCRPRP